MFFRVYCKDDVAVVDTKSQARNERFEANRDMCWSGFLVSMSDDGLSAYCTYHYMIEWKGVPRPHSLR